ncbi:MULTISPECIES: type II secretion system F family protein [Halocynthiibacter]|uniref:Type II secretion system F family protein n=1 Tax=Halocynthiibacter halioticoli TaxID=2986804 RepID=A0AAE3IZ87_9RHOB|nr:MULTISPECIES: type II secretion system F family protein [Halocynthiibacter]MCV6824434.1 type II secretion system F family protein [Halocynthiibacter halioticoli]MCW4057435.1 type II secretion system F family protein [Halocynthiibacter sp. SDUM655004]
MFDQFMNTAQSYGISPEIMMITGVGLGVLIAFYGLNAAFADRNPAAARIAASSMSAQQRRQQLGLLRAPDADPKGWMKSFVPADEAKRGELRLRLAQAGFPGPSALRNFTLVRAIFGIVLPILFLGLVAASKSPGIAMPLAIEERLGHMTNLRTFQIVTILVGLGYFAPLNWLNSRAAARKRKIEEAFPNALDLMQISIETGMGFDAAMTRVGNELARISPEISFEFLSVQHQVQAGRDRDLAMQDMADRTGVEVVRSFARVVQQSIRYGTSMSEALTTYADEMRQYRELTAQEHANKLPVKMSAVLAMLMLPALILLTVGPVVIRYIRYFAG